MPPKKNKREVRVLKKLTDPALRIAGLGLKFVQQNDVVVSFITSLMMNWSVFQWIKNADGSAWVEGQNKKIAQFAMDFFTGATRH